MDLKARTFAFYEIIEITSNFKKRLGKGGFGEVYLGTLKDGTDVAVKKLLTSSEQCLKAFKTEVKLLADVHQPNLVSLVGYCDEDGKEALILEYMSNGNLKEHLSGESSRVLIWIQRLHIALDVACGLKYLHGCKPPIVHRDLKPENILFNKYMQAKIADFGLSRAFSTESASHVSTRPAGTCGYLDPQSFKTGQVSKDSDVYSFGIILLELVTGKPAVITQDTGARINIIDWIRPLIEKGHIKNIVDPRLNDEFKTTVAHKVIKIALSCVTPIEEGHDISKILTELEKCLNKEVVCISTTSRVLVAFNNLTVGRGQTEAIKNSMNIRTFTSTEVATMTSNFKSVIEERRSYRIYLGTLNNGRQVAVKIFDPSSFNKVCPFQTEVKGISHLDHRNVVSAVGYCDEKNIKALIFEYMAKGNLRQHLSGEYKTILCWNKRLQIAIDIAHGLEYLQMSCMVHRNLTSSIIFLNEHMRGKIDDFRLPKFLKELGESDDNYESVYTDPQYIQTGRVDKKTDLYSFGIILLELLTGWPPIRPGPSSDVAIIVLVGRIMETGDFQRVVDPKLQGKFNIDTASEVAKLAMSCASVSADQRPDISHVLVELKKCLALETHSQQTE